MTAIIATKGKGIIKKYLSGTFDILFTDKLLKMGANIKL